MDHSNIYLNERAVSPTVRENAETYFIFRKKTVSELDRIRTLKHPNMGLIPYLTVRFFMMYSQDYCPEPFFVEAPSIGSLLLKKAVYSNVGIDRQASADTPAPSGHVSDGQRASCPSCRTDVKVE